jgi:hypothetical protein
MSFDQLPEEILLLIFDQFNNNSQYFVMLHVNKFCCKATTKGAKDKQWSPLIGRSGLLSWACSFKRQGESLALVEWTEKFDSTRSIECLNLAIKNSHRRLIDRILLNNKHPVDEKLLSITLFYDRKELFDYFLTLGNKYPLPRRSKREMSYFCVNEKTYKYIIEVLARKGNYDMLKEYLDRKELVAKYHEDIYKEVILCSDMEDNHKIKILNLLYKYFGINYVSSYSCANAISTNGVTILKWLLEKKFPTYGAYYKAITLKNLEAIVLLLKFNIAPRQTDIEHINLLLKDIDTNNYNVVFILNKLVIYS